MVWHFYFTISFVNIVGGRGSFSGDYYLNDQQRQMLVGPMGINPGYAYTTIGDFANQWILPLVNTVVSNPTVSSYLKMIPGSGTVLWNSASYNVIGFTGDEPTPAAIVTTSAGELQYISLSGTSGGTIRYGLDVTFF